MSCCGRKTEKHGQNKGRRRLITCLFSCCMFWFVLCAVLVTALVFVGRHLLYNSPKGRPYPFKAIITNIPEIQEVSYKRLPNDTWPVLYNLTLLPFLDRDYFEGSVNISLRVSHPKKELVLHSKNLSVASVELVQKNRKVLSILTVTENLEDEVLVITPREKIFPGEYFLTVRFRGNLKRNLRGLYKSSYKSGNKIRTIATSKFEPTYARQAFPCFDEPNMKAKYIVHLLKPKAENYIALSNYPVAKTESYDDKNDLVTFNETVSMSTYLSCFIVSDFIHTETTFNNNGTQTPLRVYASPGNLEKTTYAGQAAKAAIEFYIGYFGIPYPLPKLDMVAIPDFVSGAMEHWGLVTYRETALLYTNMTHSSANKQRVVTVVAHELAHSWFGNLVTMDWWNDLWLNEGFARYIEFKGSDAVEPTWEMMAQFPSSNLHPVLSLDATLSSHPIVVTVTTPDEITSIFDTISYNKGASILRMLEDAVGPTIFQKGVTNYLKKYAYGNAVTKNFLDEIQAAMGSAFDVSQMMDTFTLQMGYPVLNAKYDSTTDTYTLTQKRFLKDPDATYDSNVPYKYKWTVPITYITNLGKSEDRIIFPYNQDSITIKKPTGATWLKFNYDQVGYYRVNYEEEEWQKLLNIYTSLPVTDRGHLLEETFSLAEAGLLPYSIPLDLTRHLSSEFDYTPWTVASTQLRTLSLYLTESNYNTSYKNYMRDIVSNAYSKFTWNEGPNDSHLTRLARVTVLGLACTAEHTECLSQAEEKFNTWITVSTQPLSQDLRGIVYKYGMVNANEETWNKLLEVYLKETDATEKLKLLNGLANINNTTILARLLELAKNESVVRGQDYFTLLSYISGNKAGTDLVWDFVRDNWEYLVDRFTLNDRYLGTMFRTITQKFGTQQKLTEMEEFFAKYPEAGAGANARVSALENVKQNISWLAKYKASVESWIQSLTES